MTGISANDRLASLTSEELISHLKLTMATRTPEIPAIKLARPLLPDFVVMVSVARWLHRRRPDPDHRKHRARSDALAERLDFVRTK